LRGYAKVRHREFANVLSQVTRQILLQGECMPQVAEATNVATEQVATFAERVQEIRQNLHQVLVGQDASIDLLLTCALTGSHALLVGVPGLAKTLMVKALAAAFRWKFSRIQFTPDLMPSDITG
jgi:MoxR-like ATPase